MIPQSPCNESSSIWDDFIFSPKLFFFPFPHESPSKIWGRKSLILHSVNLQFIQVVSHKLSTNLWKWTYLILRAQIFLNTFKICIFVKNQRKLFTYFEKFNDLYFEHVLLCNDFRVTYVPGFIFRVLQNVPVGTGSEERTELYWIGKKCVCTNTAVGASVLCLINQSNNPGKWTDFRLETLP